jgi:hypothetical protein
VHANHNGCPVNMQLANAERRLAKRRCGGSFARARTFYRAAVECLQSECSRTDADSEALGRRRSSRFAHPGQR